MRYGWLLLLVGFGCNNDPSGTAPTPPPMSLHERLSDGPTRLQVDASQSGGVVTAEHHVAGGDWTGGPADLAISNGELILSTGKSEGGDVTFDGMQVSFETIQIPPGVFGGKDAKLTNVRFDLKNPLRSPATWAGDDEVSLDANLDVALTWTLELDGDPAPLGSPKLPAVPVELVLTGDGDDVHAALHAHAPGELWSWAGLVRLSELELQLDANLSSANP